MESLRAYLIANQANALLGLVFLAGAGFILALVSLAWGITAWQRDCQLFAGSPKKDLKETLTNCLHKLDLARGELDELEKRLDLVQRKDLKHIQRWGLVRFNPFGDTGSDQSFSLVLLDEERNGVVVSSLHGRDRTRIYAKPIKGGQADGYDLSDEEQQAISEALSG